MLLPEHPPAFVSIGQLKCKQEKKNGAMLLLF